MAITNTTTDYTGRKKDINIFQGLNFPNKSTVTLAFGDISNFCAGIQKLVQRYAITLLTELGSQPDFPDFGSTLLTRLNNTSLNLNIVDVRGIFNLANAKVIRQFRQQQSQSPSNFQDEQLNTATLDGVSVSGGKVGLRIKILSMAGERVEFVLPLPNKT